MVGRDGGYSGIMTLLLDMLFNVLANKKPRRVTNTEMPTTDPLVPA